MGGMFQSNDTIQYGLYFEMMRYLFVIYPEIYHYHFNIITDPDNELKMEDWHNNFDENVDVMLDRLNLIDSPGNRDKLRQNGLSYIDITEERKRLHQTIKRQDPSKVIPRDNGIGNKRNRF